MSGMNASIINKSGEMPARFYVFENISRYFLFELDMHFNFDAWFFGQVKDNKFQIVCSESRIDTLQSGQILEWGDETGKQLYLTDEVLIIPDFDKNNSYADTKFIKQLGIKSYIGFPVFKDNDFFGTVVGVSQTVQPENLLMQLSYLYETAMAFNSCINNEDKILYVDKLTRKDIAEIDQVNVKHAVGLS